MNWIDRAESRFGHLAIPYLVPVIGILSALAFLVSKADPYFFFKLELIPQLVMAGEVWRLVTYIFVPTTVWFLPLPDWVNAAFYVYFMIWMGSGLDNAMGAFRVNLYCLLTMAGITFAAFFFGAPFSHFILVQALFFAFARYYPEEVIFVPVPVKVKWVAWGDLAWLAWMCLKYGLPMIAALLAAMAAYFIFFGRETVLAAQFRQEVSTRRRRFEADTTDESVAIHKCAVCGKTELSAPDLEFRVAKDGEEYCLQHLPGKADKGK